LRSATSIRSLVTRFPGRVNIERQHNEYDEKTADGTL
jgi:hypothetical protein